MTDRTSSRVTYAAALVAIAAVWGLTFMTVKDAVSGYPVFAFLGWRFAIATVAFVVLFPRALRAFDRRTLLIGLAAGVFLAVGYVGQTMGLQLMDGNAASRAGFITGMFVVITPILQAIVLRRPPRWLTVAGVVTATTGLWMLSADGAAGWSLADTLVLAGAFGFAAQLIIIAGWGEGLDVGALTLSQLGVGAIACLAVAPFTGGLPMPAGIELWWALLLTGVVASAVAFRVQTGALQHLSPTGVALILIMEPVFAGLFGFLMRGERLGLAGWAGGALILAGMLMAEVVGPWLRARRDRISAVERPGFAPSAHVPGDDPVPDGPPPSPPFTPHPEASRGGDG